MAFATLPSTLRAMRQLFAISLLIAACGQSSSAGGPWSDASYGGGFGTGGSTGTGGCGACPGIACLGMRFDVQAEADASAAISNLTVTSPGLTLDCSAFGRGYQCTAYQAADGDYTITFSAPGFDPVSTSVQVHNPTNCGCCGCCPFSTQQQITLHPNGQPTGGCSDAATDADTCG